MAFCASRFKAQMVLKDYNARDVSSLLGISASAFYRKLNGKSDFTRGEMEQLIKILEIENPIEFFFNAKVS